jgi:hypothetical protein
MMMNPDIRLKQNEINPNLNLYSTNMLSDYDPNANQVYPVFNSLLNIIQNWNPDVADPPPVFYETLQHFNYSNPHERRIGDDSFCVLFLSYFVHLFFTSMMQPI